MGLHITWLVVSLGRQGAGIAHWAYTSRGLSFAFERQKAIEKTHPRLYGLHIGLTHHVACRLHWDVRGQGLHTGLTHHVACRLRLGVGRHSKKHIPACTNCTVGLHITWLVVCTWASRGRECTLGLHITWLVVCAWTSESNRKTHPRLHGLYIGLTHHVACRLHFDLTGHG